MVTEISRGKQMTLTFDEIKTRFDELKQEQHYPLNQGIKGAIISQLDKACGSKDNRYQFAAALGLPVHTSDWTVGEWGTINQMVKIDKDPALGWIATNPKFTAIVGVVMAQCGKQEGQAELFEEEDDDYGYAQQKNFD
jgi:hypothetical protein